jgi:hypothetical protein
MLELIFVAFSEMPMPSYAKDGCNWALSSRFSETIMVFMEHLKIQVGIANQIKSPTIYIVMIPTL